MTKATDTDYKAVKELIRQTFRERGYSIKFVKTQVWADPEKKSGLSFVVLAGKKGADNVGAMRVSRNFDISCLLERDPPIVVVKSLQPMQTVDFVPLADPKFKDKLFATYLNVHGKGLLEGLRHKLQGEVRTAADHVQHLIDELVANVPALANRAAKLRRELAFDFKAELDDMVKVAGAMPPKRSHGR